MNTQDDEEVSNRRAHPKNTKQWCKGKVGVEHVTEIRIPENAYQQKCDLRDDNPFWSRYTWEIGCAHAEVCVVCGKKVRHFLKKGECPTRQGGGHRE